MGGKRPRVRQETSRDPMSTGASTAPRRAQADPQNVNAPPTMALFHQACTGGWAYRGRRPTSA